MFKTKVFGFTYVIGWYVFERVTVVVGVGVDD